MILTAAAAMIVVGCGGGGGGVGAINIQTPTAVSGALNSFVGNGDSQLTLTSVEMSMAVEHANERFNTAATNTPNSGSTTQSSESADIVGIANADSIAFRGNQIAVTISNSNGGSWSEASTVVVSRINAAGYHAVQLSQTVSGVGNLYLNAYTNKNNDGNDNDYLVGGTWVVVDEVNRQIEVGAFADGSEQATNLPITAQAVYEGVAYGIRLTANTASDFSANVRLEADFDTSTIDGMITGNDLPSALTLAGNNGNINGRRFDGDTSIANGYTGKWGGEFYGDGATSAAGTFGASKGTVGEEDSDSFIGYFGTDFVPTPGDSCDAGFGADTGIYSNARVCQVRTGLCDSGAGAETGIYNRSGFCQMLTGSCDTGLGIGTGAYSPSGICVVSAPLPTISTTTTSIASMDNNGDHIVRLTQVLETGGTLHINHYITSNPTITIRMKDVSPTARKVTVGDTYRNIGTFVTIDGKNSRIHCTRFDCNWQHSGKITVAVGPCHGDTICDQIKTTTNVLTGDYKSAVYIPEGSTVLITALGNRVIDEVVAVGNGVTTSNFPVREIVVDGVIGKYKQFLETTLYINEEGTVRRSPFFGARQSVIVHISGCESQRFERFSSTCGDAPTTVLINQRTRTNRDHISDKYKITQINSENYYFEPYDNQTVVVVEGDTDYRSGGTWVYYRPENGSIEVGAFVNSPTLANTTIPFSGRATYNGNAYGIHLTNGVANNFSGEVLLEADFTANQSRITGMITSDSYSLPGGALLLEGERYNVNRNHVGDNSNFINSYDRDVDHGGFGGDTNADLPFSDPLRAQYRGSWDAQFYGENAESAAGTFNLVREDNKIITDDILDSGDFDVDFGTGLPVINTIYGTTDENAEAFIGYFNAEVDPTTSTVPSE